MDATDPKVLYAAMWEFRRTPYSFSSGGPGSGLYRSADGGATWTKIKNGLPDGDLGRIAIDISPLDHTLIYANVEAKESGFYRSTDAGSTWERRSTTSASSVRPFYFSRIVADPVDKDVIHKAGLNYYRSADGGASFDALGGSSHSDHHAMWIDKRDNAHIIDATDGGLYESFDKAKRFRHLANLPISQFYHVSVDMRAPYYVYGGLQDNGSWFAPVRTSDGIHNADWKNVGYGDGFAVLPDATDENIIFWESQGGEAQRTDLRNGETKKVQPVASREEGTLRFNWNTPIVRSAANPKVIFMGSQYLHRSSNRGDARSGHLRARRSHASSCLRSAEHFAGSHDAAQQACSASHGCDLATIQWRRGVCGINHGRCSHGLVLPERASTERRHRDRDQGPTRCGDTQTTCVHAQRIEQS